MNYLKNILIFIIFKFIQYQNIGCNFNQKDTFNWPFFKEIIKNYGSINFVFNYKFLKGSNNNYSELSHEWILSNKNIINHNFILLIEPYFSGTNFVMKFAENFTFEKNISTKFLIQVPVDIEIADKFYKFKNCSSNVRVTAWRLSYEEKYCIIFYACHVVFKNSFYVTTKQIIVMIESNMKLREINDIELDKNEYEGKFENIKHIEGKDFCMCRHIHNIISGDTFNDESKIFIAWHVIMITFIIIFTILFLIYQFLMKEKVLFKRFNNVATTNLN